MSRKPAKKDSADEDSTDDVNQDRSAEDALIDEIEESIGDEDAEIDGDEAEDGELADAEIDDDQEEFSLDQLSEAYARVINSGEMAEAEENPDADQSDSDSQPDSADDDAEELQAEGADNAACPVSPESIVESILFVGAPKDVKLTTRKIAAVLRDVSPQEVSKVVKNLNARYESEQAAYRILNDKGTVKMVLAESMAKFQRDFFGRNKNAKLSQFAIDVLAVVAYNQPIGKNEVDKIRSKSSGSLLNQLVKRELLYIVPTESGKSKSRQYATTEKFLDFFRLEDIEDLPQSHEASDIAELAD